MFGGDSLGEKWPGDIAQGGAEIRQIIFVAHLKKKKKIAGERGGFPKKVLFGAKGARADERFSEIVGVSAMPLSI